VKSAVYDVVVVDTPAVRHVEIYGCCPEPYIDITFSVRQTDRQRDHATRLAIGDVSLETDILVPVSVFVKRVLFRSQRFWPRRFRLGHSVIIEGFGSVLVMISRVLHWSTS